MNLSSIERTAQCNLGSSSLSQASHSTLRGKELAARSRSGESSSRQKGVLQSTQPVQKKGGQWQTDKKNIRALISTLDEANLFTLALVSKRLIDIGSTLAHIHPMTFMTVAIRDPDLRARLQRIFNSAIKKTVFMQGSGLTEGFRHRLEREARRNNLEPHIEPFAQALDVAPKEIRPLIKAGRWNALFVQLCQKAFRHGR